MNSCLLICSGYVFFCLLFSTLVTCVKAAWKDLYNTLIIETLNDLKSANVSVKILTFLIVVIILTVVFFLFFLTAPFCFYWLNRSYRFEKERQKTAKEFQEKMSNIVPEPPVKKEYLYPPIIIKLEKNLPFTPVREQVIYLESLLNEHLNKYISKEYKKITKAFKYHGLSFIYIPLLIKKIADSKKEIASYTFPDFNNEDIYLDEAISAQYIENSILSYSDEPANLTGGLLRFKETVDNYHIFTYYQFEKFEENEIWEQFRAYLDNISGRENLYSISSENPNDNADDAFSYAAQHLIDEINERIEQLQQIGISEMILKSLLKFDDTVKLSKMVITNDYRIVLPDYNHLEITMSPLPKAVYFLFLKHTEGILFKHLPDYKDELMCIYKQVSNREKLRDMKKSINDVTDPTKNAINEKCSRIREAFVKHFDEQIAKNYFITGTRSEPKKIILPRTLIAWETEM